MKYTTNYGNRGAFNPLTPGGTPVIANHQEIVREAVVVDVIVNDEHPEYAEDGYNVGAIKFRSLKGDMYVDSKDLQWAFPLNANISEYPLIDELVTIHTMLNRTYYDVKINTTNRVTAQPIHGLNSEMEPIISQEIRSEGYRKNTSERRHLAGARRKLGKKFKDKESVYRLRHDEGDVVIEGRSGQSIRLGASWKSGAMFQSQVDEQSPNIILRAGPDESQYPNEGRFGLVKEDINLDKSSIYIVSDQLIPLKYATSGTPPHTKSISDFPNRLGGPQLIFNSNRVIINAKTDKLMGFSRTGIHWTTARDYTVDVGENHKSWVGKDQLIKVVGRSIFDIGDIYEVVAGSRSSIVAPKVYIGTRSDETQPIACGSELALFLEQFLDAFIKNSQGIAMFTAAPGSPSPINPVILTQLIKLKADVAKKAHASFNSKIAYTTK